MSIFEDPRIFYYFSERGKFLEYQDTTLYSYRIHDNHISTTRKEIDRLRLINWLKNLKINKSFKFLLMVGAKFQFLIFYKKIPFGNTIFNKILFKLKYAFINFRSGV